jgi:zinc D-Ala-D-Ala carboxypeptidase
MPEMISPHFSLAELTITQQVDANGVILPNVPNSEQMFFLNKLAFTILEPIRTLIDCPIHVNSAFRCEAIEIKVSGKAYGQHMKGQAADIVPFNHHLVLKDVYEKIMTSVIPYDQLLYEYGAWIHVSCAPANTEPRRMPLMIGSWTNNIWMPYDSKAVPV